ncbi:putative fungal-specific transcription factor [Thelonectria olida]|uniref:Fungal-specific transcription factor n=1 Tax=Thelonectria olida TaxID=1576542 RepID=A0A9P8WFH2_9HYPO|nr:putative fungal-specific transcription factor [Thelonectria olida]
MESNQGITRSQGRVTIACQRCRKQRLKCDVERPCFQCIRSGAKCVAVVPDKWKVHQPKRNQSKGENQTREDSRLSANKRRRTTQNDEGREETAASVSPSTAHWKNSSTIGLVAEAFHHYHADAPEDSKTSSLAATQWHRTVLGEPDEKDYQKSSLQGLFSRHRQVAASMKSERARGVAEQAATELASLLPSFNTVSLLVDNYFDRIHWFTLLFHQEVFRQRFHRLYSDSRDVPSTDSSSVGHLSVLLAVCAISLEHLSVGQLAILDQDGVDVQVLQHKILSTLRVRLLDMLSLGSLETVQTCVLLGTYYLNQGEPELAWPLCGCGLRIAQALNLHRSLSLPESSSPQQLARLRRVAEARKRCWWAIYEFETLCSMIYGFPLSISDEDCDVGPLDAHDEYSGSVRGVSARGTTLLSYKCAMSQLSLMIRSAIKDLYGSGRNSGSSGDSVGEACQRVVHSLDSRILKWYESLPGRLKLGQLYDQPFPNLAERRNTKEKTARQLEDDIFQLQALTLKLAYENARILIHRPLLSYRFTDGQKGSSEAGIPSHSFQSSIQTCRSAALQVSRLGSAPIFHQVSETYAVAFVSLHLLTAGIALCILTNLDTLSVESHESKVAVHRLMGMQHKLKSKSIVAAQGLGILGQLMSLVMAKEMDKMFEFMPDRQTDTEPGTQQTEHSGDSTNTTAQDETAAPVPHGTFENGIVSQTLQDFEQVVMDPDLNSLFGGTRDFGLGDFGIVGQDQGWIWGSGYGL